MKKHKQDAENLFRTKKAELKAENTAKNLASSSLPEKEILELEMLNFNYKEKISKMHPNETEYYQETFEITHVHNTTGIEGNTLTLPETENLLKNNITPGGKNLKEVYEVRNYKPAIEFMKEYNGELNLNLMKKLHSLIAKDIDEHTLGELRRIQVHLRGSELTPSPAVLVEEDLKKLTEWHRKNKAKLHPVELAAKFHLRFEQIHPFTDGNGRVGRELLNFILKKQGCIPVTIRAKERNEYIKALAEGDKKNFKPIVQLIRKTLARQYQKIVKNKLEKETGSKEKQDTLQK